MKQIKIDSRKQYIAIEKHDKRCGNCGHLTAKKGTVAEKTWQKELNSGICDLTKKSMIGSLIAGCHYWCDRNIEKEIN